MTLLLMIAALLVLLALRVPVGVALMVPSLIYILTDPTASLALAVQQSSSGVFDFAILAVPMFILLGNLANVSGATDRSYDAAVALMGHVRGSLGYVNILTSLASAGSPARPSPTPRRWAASRCPRWCAADTPGFSLGITGASSLIAP